MGESGIRNQDPSRVRRLQQSKEGAHMERGAILVVNEKCAEEGICADYARWLYSGELTK